MYRGGGKFRAPPRRRLVLACRYVALSLGHSFCFSARMCLTLFRLLRTELHIPHGGSLLAGLASYPGLQTHKSTRAFGAGTGVRLSSAGAPFRKLGRVSSSNDFLEDFGSCSSVS
uniref:Putative secreted protein n=1 Tax=Ixodes ricinus TaxID=34613 RepID=A0A6B0UKX3_IXORI